MSYKSLFFFLSVIYHSERFFLSKSSFLVLSLSFYLCAVAGLIPLPYLCCRFSSPSQNVVLLIAVPFFLSFRDFPQKMATALSENPASVIHSINLAHNSLDNQGICIKVCPLSLFLSVYLPAFVCVTLSVSAGSSAISVSEWVWVFLVALFRWLIVICAYCDLFCVCC